jgi:Methylase involved in ubiquinone/menaquinone biosynthesis
VQHTQKILACYNKTANNYSDRFINELSYCHLDRILLKAFALENSRKGPMLDLGCGPGQTTKFLAENGVTDITGADLSPEMIRVAKSISPLLRFEQADMLELHYPANSFAAVIAFYAIVHFDQEQVLTAFKEIKRVLKDGGHFLFSFHVGDEIIHLDNFLDIDVDIDLYFFSVRNIRKLLTEVGFEIIDIIQRQPYAEDYQTERAYIWVKKR